MTVGRSFVDALAASARQRFSDPARLELVLARHVAAAGEAWPDLAIAPERFSAELARRLGEDATPERLDATHASDVYLAIACAEGVTAAIAACTAVLDREVGFAATKTSATSSQAAEIGANLRRILFVDEPPRRAAVRDYAGRGDLKSYLRVMAMRDLIRAVQRSRREVPLETDDLLASLVPAQDPELAVLREQYREHVDEAMRAAVASLEDRSRALLRFQFVDRWNVDRVGALYGVHRATAARWIAAARAELGDKFRQELATRLKVATDELESIVRLVRSRVDVSLERILGA